MNRARHFFRLIGLAVGLLMMAGSATAASLEKIEVSSRLGEPFYAEIALNLEADELVSKVFVEIASASDYKIFEVYRDAAVNGIRADVNSGARGTYVKLSSSKAIRAPFFNLIVKIRHGRVSHFKKYPVFLEPAKSVVNAAEKAPVASVQQSDVPAEETASAQVVEVEEVPAEQSARVDYFEGWARTGRYGPIVRGDMLSTVVHRLRIDNRYTLSQVSVALFEKNRSKFDKENMNLLLSGSYLDVPTAAEVERLSSAEAYKVFEAHKKQFQELKQQPKYAAEAEAQRTRYSKRVSVGQVADGVASSPVAVSDAASGEPAAKTGADASSVTSETAATLSSASAETAVGDQGAVLAELRKQNEMLQQKLVESEQRIEALSQKVDESGAAVSDAKVKRLEVLVARLQEDLVRARAEAATAPAGLDWIVWVLIGLVVVLLVVVVLLMRREPAHPSQSVTAGKEVEEVEPEIEEPSVPVAVDVASEPKADTDTFNLKDDLSETDTAEMVAVDSSALDDAHTDYLSEVDVYIRYGMEEEALQQLELALRASPNNVEAHIRKAELLKARGDHQGFDAATAAALAVLSGAALEQFNSAIGADIVDDDQVLSDEPVGGENVSEEVSEASETDTGESDDSPILDFDLSGFAAEEEVFVASGDDQESAPVSTKEQGREMDWLHQAPFEDEVEDTSASGSDEGEVGTSAEAEEKNVGEEQVSLTADNQSEDETDWLQQTSFEDEVEEAPDSEAGEGEGVTLDVDENGSEIDAILDEFEDDAMHEISLEGDSIDMEHTAEELPESEGTIEIDENISITQELDDLLENIGDETESPETGEGGNGTATSALDMPATEEELTATQHLDNLLGAFDDEDDFEFTGDDETISFDVDEESGGLEQGREEGEDLFGETQHLDSFISGFASSQEEGGDHIQFEDNAGLDIAEEADSGDQDATQQFEQNDLILGEHKDEGLSDSSEEHDATQELDQLLKQFGNEDEDEENRS